jgi:cation transport ATPase
MTTQRITLPIYNLGCGGGGSLAIERALTKTPGVAQAYVNPATEMAYVVYDPALANPEQFAAVIERMGYGPPRVATHRAVGTPPPDRASRARRRWDVRGLAIVAGLGLAAIYALCIVVDLLLPDQFQIYRLWERVLLGVSWAVPWTLLLGLVEAFLYGAIGAWAFARLYRALPGRARQQRRA